MPDNTPKYPCIICGKILTTKNNECCDSCMFCKHEWDKLTGIKEKGIPHIGVKSKWVRTCQKCGKREVFSSGIFNGWFSE